MLFCLVSVQLMLCGNSSSANLIVHYDFNGNAKDVSGNGFDGTVFGSPTYVAGQSDGAIYINNPYWFATGTQYVHLPSVDLGMSSFTVGINFKTTDTGKANGRLFGGYSNNDTTLGLNYMAGGNSTESANPNISAGIGQQHAAVTSNPADPRGYATDGKWHWEVAVVDRSNDLFSLYLDGYLIGTSTIANLTRPFTLDNHSIGRAEGDGTTTSYAARFTTIDDFRVYDVALTSSEIANVSAVPEPNTISLLCLGLAGIAVANVFRRSGGKVRQKLRCGIFNLTSLFTNHKANA